jgi:two-component system copper resistance phosphate regulon response regulator CusR
MFLMSDIGFLSMRILLVEDEQKTGDYLKQGLSEAGYITDWVTDGLSGKHQALSEEYDLIILDVMLPKLDGWNIIYDIRKSGKTCLFFSFSVIKLKIE